MIFHWFKKNSTEPTITYKKMSRKDASEELVKKGEDAANGNNYEQALKFFEQAIEMNSENDFAWSDRGLMLDRQGKPDEALASFSRAIKINPTNPITWHNKGLVFIRSERMVEAIECFDKAISLNEKYAKAWYNKGRALAMLRKVDESQVAFDKAKKLDPFLYTKLKKLKS